VCDFLVSVFASKAMSERPATYRVTGDAVDMVNHPPHYNQGEIECIDAIRAALGSEGFEAYCRGNAIKYAWRSRHKGGKEDLRKAAWYLNKATESRSSETGGMT